MSFKMSKSKANRGRDNIRNIASILSKDIVDALKA